MRVQLFPHGFLRRVDGTVVVPAEKSRPHFGGSLRTQRQGRHQGVPNCNIAPGRPGRRWFGRCTGRRQREGERLYELYIGKTSDIQPVWYTTRHMKKDDVKKVLGRVLTWDAKGHLLGLGTQISSAGRAAEPTPLNINLDSDRFAKFNKKRESPANDFACH
jgi:hypothetical protein